MRDVASHEYVGACRYTGYVAKSVRLHLSCGHEMVRKASAGIPRRAKCYECTRDRCPNCKGLKSIRNPTGTCDHLYWPDYLTPEARAKVGC